MSSDLIIGFLGAGKMATALAQGLIRAGITVSDRIVASDPFEAARKSFAEAIGCKTTALNADVARAAKVLMLAVKPDTTAEVLKEISPHFTSRHLLISIAAGIPLERLEGGLNPDSRVIRVMPNTPALVGASASAYALGRFATPEDRETARLLFGASGLAVETPERLLDAVTGLSGSGPAYVAIVIEALADGGVAAGLPRDLALKLAAQTVFGSAKMMIESGLHPAALKDMVASPGGTTIEGIHELERGGVRAAFINAVRAAADKSKKLGAK